MTDYEVFLHSASLLPAAGLLQGPASNASNARNAIHANNASNARNAMPANNAMKTRNAMLNVISDTNAINAKELAFGYV